MWAFLPLIVVAAYAGANSEREFFGDYQLVAVSQAWVALIVVGPLLAGWAAWDASRLRPWLDVASDGQHRGKAIARMVAPALTLAMTVVCAAVLLVTGWPSDLASWTVTAGAGFTMLAAGTFGAALGLAVPKLVAVPIGVLGTYAVMAAAVADPHAGSAGPSWWEWLPRAARPPSRSACGAWSPPSRPVPSSLRVRFSW